MTVKASSTQNPTAHLASAVSGADACAGDVERVADGQQIASVRHRHLPPSALACCQQGPFQLVRTDYQPSPSLQVACLVDDTVSGPARLHTGQQTTTPWFARHGAQSSVQPDSALLHNSHPCVIERLPQQTHRAATWHTLGRATGNNANTAQW